MTANKATGYKHTCMSPNVRIINLLVLNRTYTEQRSHELLGTIESS